ncbi:MAG: DUF4125 family protein [Lachnospiraceae bacterium]|nr:DUF4125 family protein [Lachnospiraceae bacterium]MBR6469102.1 DUF4125 family protein [Lachnospiraceae bacterium]
MSEISLNTDISSCIISNVGGKGNAAGISDREAVNELIMLEWQAFDKVINEGGRASCQDDYATFSIMRRSQYDTWTDEMLDSFIDDFYSANERGWNLITEKYARMEQSTAPEEYAKLKDELPPVSEAKAAIVDQIVDIQVGWMEEFASRYPKAAARSRSIRSSEDTKDNTSYETYLRGELLTYSDRTLALYGQFIVKLAGNRENLAFMIMENTAKAYGYSGLDDMEAGI